MASRRRRRILPADDDLELDVAPNRDPEPPTDEFGRDDPAAVERERRRREREQRRDAVGRRVSRAGGGGRARRRSPPVRDRRAFRRRRAIAIGAAFVGVLLLWFLVAFFQPFAGEGQGEGTIAVTIPNGADAGQIAEILADKGVVPSKTLFLWRLRLSGKAEEIQADTYSLASEMSYGAAIDRLTGAAADLPTLAIPEGLSRREIAKTVAQAGVSGDYAAASKGGKPYGFDPARYGARSARSLEGFLFPATYELQPGSTAKELVRAQLTAFGEQIKGVDMSYAKSKNLTVYDVLIIASMVEREAQVAKERPLVASVIYNRLRAGIPLGLDATTRFALGNWSKPLTDDELGIDSPYNTRHNAGLPPGPIGNPGLASIKAAAKPAKTGYLYFVVKPYTCGEHTFTETAAEFEQASAAYQAALQKEGRAPTRCP